MTAHTSFYRYRSRLLATNQYAAELRFFFIDHTTALLCEGGLTSLISWT